MTSHKNPVASFLKTVSRHFKRPHSLPCLSTSGKSTRALPTSPAEFAPFALPEPNYYCKDPEATCFTDQSDSPLSGVNTAVEDGLDLRHELAHPTIHESPADKWSYTDLEQDFSALAARQAELLEKLATIRRPSASSIMSCFSEEGQERLSKYGHLSDLGLMLEDRRQTTYALRQAYGEDGEDQDRYLDRPGSINAAWSFATTDNPEVAMVLLESMRCRANLRRSEQGRKSNPLINTENTLRYILETQFTFEFDNLNTTVTQSLLSSARAARNSASGCTLQRACRRVTELEDKLKAFDVRPRQVARAKELAEACMKAIEAETGWTESKESVKRVLSQALASSTVDQGSAV